MNDHMKALRGLAEKWRGEYQEFPPGTQEHGLYAGTLWCADELEAALAAIGGEQGWRPIESAPRDGTMVLLFFTAWGSRGPDGRDNPPDSKGHTYIGRWDGSDWTDGEAGFYGRECTHWRPLPAPPREGA